MELFFRKYFWSVHLLFIMLVAFLAARTVNVFLESSILPLSSGEVAKRPARRTPTEALARLDLARLAKLTGLPVPKPEPEVTEPEPIDPNATPVKSTLRVRLLGTLVGSHSERSADEGRSFLSKPGGGNQLGENLFPESVTLRSNPSDPRIAGQPSTEGRSGGARGGGRGSVVENWSFASILDLGTQRAQTYVIGDTIQGAEIVEIERARVIILNNRRREFIDAQPGDGSAIAYTPPAARTAEPPSTALGTGILALADGSYDVPRGEIDKTLSNLNDVAMQARIVPAFKDGQAQGFKLFSIRPDSIYTKIGIQNGDVIKRINGYDLNSPEKALEIYSKLRDTSRIDIEIERNGAALRKTYNVR